MQHSSYRLNVVILNILLIIIYIKKKTKGIKVVGAVDFL